jgi:superfamily I DNA and RNA helicase
MQHYNEEYNTASTVFEQMVEQIIKAEDYELAHEDIATVHPEDDWLSSSCEYWQESY